MDMPDKAGQLMIGKEPIGRRQILGWATSLGAAALRAQQRRRSEHRRDPRRRPGLRRLSAWAAATSGRRISTAGGSGVRFDRFYANSPVCSPTRAALLTAAIPTGGRARRDPHGAREQLGLSRRDAVCCPQCSSAGYHSALVGKWHLGLDSPNLPNQRGFDFFHGFLGDMMDDYWTHRRHGQNYMRLNDRENRPAGSRDRSVHRVGQRVPGLAERPARALLPLPRLQRAARSDPAAAGVAGESEATRAGHQRKRAKLVALIEHMDAGSAGDGGGEGDRAIG